MQIGRYRFAPPWWGVAITLVGMVILCLLGVWQIERAHYKTHLQAEQDAARAAGVQPMPPIAIGAGDPDTGQNESHQSGPQYGRRYRVRGHYDTAHQLLLANQVEGTQTGYRVWTPLVLASGVRVMVDRGWIAKDTAANAARPNPAAPTGTVRLQGYWRGFPQPGLRFGDTPVCKPGSWPRALNYPSTATVRCQYPGPVADGLLLLSPDDPHGFLRNWDTDRVGLSPFAHYAYASQWFLMAIVAFVIFIVVNLKRDRS